MGANMQDHASTPVMDSDRMHGRPYRLILKGELSEPFGFLFEGMTMTPCGGTTVLTGIVIDQVHLHGLLEQVQELGLELVSVEALGPDNDSADTSG